MVETKIVYNDGRFRIESRATDFNETIFYVYDALGGQAAKWSLEACKDYIRRKVG